MTISDKIRIYELSRDLNLENKDILDAAQKLSISVKSHSSSITAEDAKKIKNLINKKNSDKKILSINKPSFKKDTYKEFLTEEHDHNHVELVSDSIKLNYFLEKMTLKKRCQKFWMN